VRKLLARLLTRFAAFALAFAVATCAALLWRTVRAPRSSPDSSVALFAVLTRADAQNPVGAEGAGATAWHYWILRHSFAEAQPASNRPVASYRPETSLITFNCVTITVLVDDARRLHLQGESFGTLDEPAALGAKLASLFRDREVYRADKQGRELPVSGRIERTVIIYPADSLKYGEILELVNFLERTGATPIILQTGGGVDIPCLSIRE
jgi:hypothetical protein